MPTAPVNSIHPETRADWRAWLAENHGRTTGVWLITFKKGSGRALITYDDAVEEALCFGWVDSKSNKLDAERSMLWMAPRKPGTGWSKLNKERIARLEAAGLLAPAGAAKVETARQDGSWNALDEVEALVVPPDLTAALAENAQAAGYFDAFPRSVKRAILEWIASARKPETRAKRIEETVRLAADNIRANQWRQ